MAWYNILGGLAAPVVDYLKNRQEIKSKERLRQMELEDALNTRRIELIRQGLTADMNWEMEFARQAQSSWKDEYTLLVTSIPAVMSFVPGWAQYVYQGFEALAKTPLWYQILLSSMFLATIGIRYWRRTQSDT